MSELTHWSTDSNGNYHLKREERALLLGFDKGFVWIEENCDNYFDAKYSKDEAIEMLNEAIKIIKGGL